MKATRKHRSGSIRVSRRILRGGQQEGTKVIKIDNGRLSIDVCPTRGMGVLCARCGNLFLGWNSPLGYVVHPRNVVPRARGGTGWLDGFTEFVVRCGLRNIGRPGWDVVPNRQGRGGPEFLTQHGPVANLPAYGVSIRRTSRRIEVSGEVREATETGVLELATTLSTVAGSRSFRITDVVTNRGSAAAEFQMLYHSNLGEPLLGKRARFLAPIDSIAGRNARAARGLASFDCFRGRTPGFKEQVYMMWLRADERAQTVAALVNPSGDAAVSIAFSVHELPCMTLWKQTGGTAERFVTGLEPGTSFPYHRSFERIHGRVKILAPGESHRMTLVYRVYCNAGEVAALRQRIGVLQKSASPRALRLAQFHARGKLLRNSCGKTRHIA